MAITMNAKSNVSSQNRAFQHNVR